MAGPKAPGARKSKATDPRGKSVTIVGAGGNIGSHLVPHIARLAGVSQVTLIDPDIYTEANIPSQDIDRRDVGKRKVVIQAKRLNRITGDIEVTVIAEPVESVPLGRLHADVIVACLDSRRARQAVNQSAWRLGIPWVDAAVEAGGLLARINSYIPHSEAPCLECAWGEADYALVEQSYPCQAESSVPATNAPSYLGALAASLQAIEIDKLLHGMVDRSLVGSQLFVDASAHQQYRTVFRRNPRCLFDHQVWEIERLETPPGRLTVKSALELGGNSGEGASQLRVDGDAFVWQLSCTHCGKCHPALRLARRLGPEHQACRECGAAMVAHGFDMEDRIEAKDPRVLALRYRSLASLGLRRGDVFSVAGLSGERHYEIGG